MTDNTWENIKACAREQAVDEPALAQLMQTTIIDHNSLASALSYHLAQKLHSDALPAESLRELIAQILAEDSSIISAVQADLSATQARDSACRSLLTPFLFFKGFHALQAYRIAHRLWQQGRFALAFFLQNRISVVFSVDIHPAAVIGQGIMLDHGTGIVIGETAVVENDVSIMQAVTLGGTGKETGDRHPKVRSGVLISAGAKILGNIEIGHCAKVGAGSVVLRDVLPRTTVAGVPAKRVDCGSCDHPSIEMNHLIEG